MFEAHSELEGDGRASLETTLLKQKERVVYVWQRGRGSPEDASIFPDGNSRRLEHEPDLPIGFDPPKRAEAKDEIPASNRDRRVRGDGAPTDPKSRRLERAPVCQPDVLVVVSALARDESADPYGDFPLHLCGKREAPPSHHVVLVEPKVDRALGLHQIEPRAERFARDFERAVCDRELPIPEPLSSKLDRRANERRQRRLPL